MSPHERQVAASAFGALFGAPPKPRRQRAGVRVVANRRNLTPGKQVDACSVADCDGWATMRVRYGRSFNRPTCLDHIEDVARPARIMHAERRSA